MELSFFYVQLLMMTDGLEVPFYEKHAKELRCNVPHIEKAVTLPGFRVSFWICPWHAQAHLRVWHVRATSLTGVGQGQGQGDSGGQAQNGDDQPTGM